MGDKAITISLTETQTSPPAPQKKEQAQTRKPQKTKVPETKSEVVAAAKPLEKIQQPVAASRIKPRAKKTVQTIKKAPAQSSNATAGKTSAAPIKTSAAGQQAPAAAEPTIIKASPLYDQNPKPPYPSLAIKRGWQGVVLLAVMVLANGSPAQLKIQQSCGYELLDKTALATVRRWHFLPGTKNNVPTAMEVLVPVHFKLQ